MTCKKQQETDRTENGVKVFLRYVDDIFGTIECDPGVVLEAANKLHPYLQFTIEELDINDNLAFLVLNVNVDSGKRSYVDGCKITDTGIILNFRVCAPLQYKRNDIEETVNRVFRSGKRNDKWLKESPPLFTMQYRGNPSQLLAVKGSDNIRGTNKFYNKKN